MVMQNLYIVYGRPSWSSKFLIATINTCGRFEPLKFELTSNGVCNNGVANVKCVAWTTPKGVTHDENGKPVTSKSPLALRGTAVTIQMAIDEVGIAKRQQVAYYARTDVTLPCRLVLVLYILTGTVNGYAYR